MKYYHTLWSYCVVIKFGNTGFYFHVQISVTVELGTINYYGCKYILFLASNCAYFTDVLVFFDVTY